MSVVADDPIILNKHCINATDKWERINLRSIYLLTTVGI